MLNNVQIVLVNTTHPGNIGAVARAMKTMELQNLTLVSPKKFPDVNATALASGADDILEKARVTKSLAEALADTEIVFATTARFRELQLPTSNPKDAAEFIVSKIKNHKISIVFGRESSGLTNKEMELCNKHLYIPTNPNFPALNIAAALQIVVYEIKMALNEQDKINFDPNNFLATNKEVNSFYNHLEQTLLDVDFLKPSNHYKLIQKIKRLFNRSQLEKSEINILRGILTKVDNITKNR